VFWLQPLNRIAARGLVDAAEPVCDGWALSRTRSRCGDGWWPRSRSIQSGEANSVENVIVRQIGSRETGPDFAGTRRIGMLLSGDAAAGELNPGSNAVFIRRFGREVEPGADGG
jgi:hypothetical protein